MPPQTVELVEIRTTFAAHAAAAECANRIVAEGLAACVQIDGPIRSTYRWQGAVEQAEEWRCTFKTTPARADACVAGILAGHPYETPEVLVTRLAATAAYAAWVRDAVAES